MSGNKVNAKQFDGGFDGGEGYGNRDRSNLFGRGRGLEFTPVGYEPMHWLVRLVLSWIGIIVPVVLSWLVILFVFYDGSANSVYENALNKPRWALELEIFNSSWITGALFLGLAAAVVIWFRDSTIKRFVEGESAWYRTLSILIVFFFVYLFYPVVLFNLHSLGGAIFIAILLAILSFIVLAYLFYVNVISGIVFTPVVLYTVYLSILTIEIYTNTVSRLL